MREWLRALDIKDRNVIGLDLMRSGLSSNRIARVLFFVEDGPPLLVLLLIFGLPAYLLVRRYRRKHSRL